MRSKYDMNIIRILSYFYSTITSSFPSIDVLEESPILFTISRSTQLFRFLIFLIKRLHEMVIGWDWYFSMRYPFSCVFLDHVIHLTSHPTNLRGKNRSHLFHFSLIHIYQSFQIYHNLNLSDLNLLIFHTFRSICILGDLFVSHESILNDLCFISIQVCFLREKNEK